MGKGRMAGSLMDTLGSREFRPRRLVSRVQWGVSMSTQQQISSYNTIQSVSNCFMSKQAESERMHEEILEKYQLDTIQLFDKCIQL